MATLTIKVDGNWDKGLAFDVHTLSSTYLGPDEYGHDLWDTTRTEMGQLIYSLKRLTFNMKRERAGFVF